MSQSVEKADSTANAQAPAWQVYVLTALSLSIGWGIRGNFGHEFGAMIPGALAAIAVVLLSGRADWQRRVAEFAMFGALGWSFGGSMSYMQVVAYTHSGHSPSVLYGFACLFAIGFLWAAFGGAGTALPAVLDRDWLVELYAPMAAVFVAWTVQELWLARWISRNLLRPRGYSLNWYDSDWLGVLVAIAAVLVLAALRRRLDRGSSLILHMAFGWWVGFLLLPNALGLRMTPPRGDNWAGCVGMFAGLLVYCARYRLAGVALAALVSGFIGGIGFATAAMLKLVELTCGLDTNWHSVMEQTTGLFNGLGIAAGMLLLAHRAPQQTDKPRGTAHDAWAVVFVLVLITFLNLRKNPDEWVKAHAMPEVLYGLPAWAWFHIAYAALAAAIGLLLARHLQQPLAIVPATWLGKGQLLYVVFLWWMVIGNLERALVSFAPQRLVTEGVIHLNAALSMVLLLCWSRPPSQAGPSAAQPPSYAQVIRRTLAIGLAAAALSVLADWSIVRAIYGDRFAGYANLHIRFGPNATTSRKEAQPAPAEKGSANKSPGNH